ncbi:MAG: DUF86 domain-containing protein [Bacteroidales bacterium]|jgi:uncharacterized protein with HEPN domain|nr:DUF86 domain-containing protein [Bacteroidales bacterium]
MYKNYIDLLHHILLECRYIESVITPQVSKDIFMADETLKRAIVRSLEVIGEATKKIPADIKLRWSEIAWKNIAGMRDRLIHDYMGINYFIVWDVARNIIPGLREQIDNVISKEES